MHNTATRIPRALTMAEFAERLGVCPRTVKRWIDAGELRHHRLGRLVRITEGDASAFISARRQ